MKNTNYVLFVFGLILATLVALLIIPGLDFIVWYLLKPVGYWQRLALMAAEVLIGFPRMFVAFFVWLATAKLFQEMSE